MRPVIVIIHRYVGLSMAAFLLVAGLTGMLLAFNQELESWISPALFTAQLPENTLTHPARAIDILTLRERVAQQYPHAHIHYVRLDWQPEQNRYFYLFAKPGQKDKLTNNQVFVNPYSGSIVGERNRGDLSQGLKNLMPFIYRLHYALALDQWSRWGSWIMGIAALLWAIDAFWGVYLTFPAAIRKKGTASKPVKSWWQRWQPSWRIRWNGGIYKINFDIHRAGALWLWLMFFIFAWSSVAFNLKGEVYDPVMKTLFAHQAPLADFKMPSRPQETPVLSWTQALQRGRVLMTRQLAGRGATLDREYLLYYMPRQGLYQYRVFSSLDISEKWGETCLYFNAQNGELAGMYWPSGEASGDTIYRWLTNLHMAGLWGLPMQIFVCFCGLMVSALSITGVYIWWKKRKGRIKQRNKRRAAQTAA